MRLEKIQNQLFQNQIIMNKSLENKTLNVLVENFTEDKKKLFGRSEHMTPVILMVRKIILEKFCAVKINKSNSRTLFGEIINNSDQKVA